MVLIRTDANESIATGHVMRCLTIAKQLVRLKEKVVFLVSDERSIQLIQETGYSYENLNSDYAHPDNEIEIAKMWSILSSYEQKPKLLLDSYCIPASYMYKLSEYAKLICIDDLFEESYPVDLLINYTLYYDRFDYCGRYAGTKTKLLLGGDYVPLREAFTTAEKPEQPVVDASRENQTNRNNQEGVLNVLVICGGGDQFNVMGSIFARMEELSGQQQKTRYLEHPYHYYVVAGAYNPNKEVLLDLQQRHSNICICENVEDMAGLMRKCDIAISAASTVLYECCAVKLPTIFFCVADNQKYDQECFTKDEVMLYAGDVRLEKKQAIDCILTELERLSKDESLRMEMKSKMSRIVDGKGAARIAESILQL